MVLYLVLISSMLLTIFMKPAKIGGIASARPAYSMGINWTNNEMRGQIAREENDELGPIDRSKGLENTWKDREDGLFNFTIRRRGS